MRERANAPREHYIHIAVESVQKNPDAFKGYMERRGSSIKRSEPPYYAVLPDDTILVSYHSAKDCGIVSVSGQEEHRVERECAELANSLGRVDNPEAVRSMIEFHQAVYEERRRASKAPLN